MSDSDKRESEATAVCHVCGKQIPRSAAHTAEGREYSYFFCGSGCQQRWSANERMERDAQRHDAHR